ncbi:SCO6880 family protein [Streptomyces sp. NPDC049879]|uniref:SCO6880 family protein n=1 Tax=Streptomyces sp. NPDC049879 TaxID=3365598 RepID=UPI0037B64DA3
MAREVRLYGGWRQPRGVGLGQLTPGQTLVVLGVCAVCALLLTFSVRTLWVTGPVALVVGIGAAARWRGEPLLLVVVRAVRWQRGVRAGQDEYVSGVLTQYGPDADLPGLLAPVRLLECEDGDGGHFGLAWNRRTGLLAATLRVAPVSTALADDGTVDGWVAQWGAWLARLGHVPSVAWVTVTVDTAPDPGSTLADYAEARIDPDAPEIAVQVLRELVRTSPAASAAVETLVTIVFDPARSPQPAETFAEAVAETGRLLAGLQRALTGCGVTVLGRASAARLAGMIRVAFDPGARAEVARALVRDPDDTGREAGAEQLLASGAAGPLAARELPDRYEHDSGVSVGWVWALAPRQHVTSDVLIPLLAPGRWPRRVALSYRPYTAEQAAEHLNRQVNAAQYRSELRTVRQGTESATDAADRARAEQAAAEEAQGAGLGLMSLAVTTTVTDPAELDAAVADVEQRGGTSRIRLRRAWRAQAAVFAATLPLGIYLPDAVRRRAR